MGARCGRAYPAASNGVSMVGHSEQIATLNGLSTTLVDSVNGYRNAAGKDMVGLFKDFFLEHASERQRVVEKLRATVVELGGKPAGNQASFLGRTHRGWLGLKAVLLGHDEKAIISEVERGELFLKKKFEAALDDEHLSGAARLAVQEAYQSVRNGHREICRMNANFE